MKTLKNLLGFSLGPIIGMLISMITIPVTTYFIAPAETGKAAVFTTTQNVLLLFIYLGMDNAYIREYHEAKDKKELLTNCISLPMAFDAIVLLLSPIYAARLSDWMFGETHKGIIFLFALSLLFMTITRFIYLEIRMQERAVLYSVLHIVSKLIILILTIVYIALVRRDFLTIIYANLIGQIVFDIILVVLFWNTVAIKIECISLNRIINLLKYGLPLAGVAIVGYLLNSIDTFFLKSLSTYEEIGFYAIASKITGFLSVIQSAFGTFWIPTSYRWYSEGKPIEKYEQAGRLLALLMSLIFVGILLLRDLIPIVISKDYKNALPIIPFLLFYPIMYTLGITTELGIQFKKKTNYSLVISIIALFVNAILNYILIPILGGRGAAITTGISYILFFWMKTIKSRQLWEKFDIGYLVKVNAILLICSIINTFVSDRLVLYMCNILGIVIIIFVFKNETKYCLEYGRTYFLNWKNRKGQL